MPFRPIVRDDMAPHQIRVWLRGNDLHVSCTCHGRNNFGNGGQRYESMGVFKTEQEKKVIYDDPANHNEKAHKFKE